MRLDRFRIPVVVGGALVSCLLLAGCGSEDTAGEGGDGGDDATATDQDGDPGGDDPDEGGSDELEFSFSLPGGDLSPLDLERDVHNALRRSCAEGQDALDQKWESFLNARAVLLYQSAVHVCFGDLDAGRALLDRAAAEHGWMGIAASEADCATYKAIVSVLEQRTQDGMTCPDGGTAPGWPETDAGGVHDDPRTPDIDERVTDTTTSSTGAPTSSPTTGTTPPTTAAPATAGPTSGA